MARKFRSLLLAAVLLLSFVVPSGNAYADGYAGVVYGPKATAVVNPEYGVIVNAGSSFDAALYAIGYNPDSSEFTSDVKAYLSNSDSGGAFYTFAQKFTNHNDKWGDGGFAGAVGGTVGIDQFDLNMTTSLKMFNNMYGPSNVWCGQYTATERVAAVASVGLVLSGEVGGGSGSGSVEVSEIPEKLVCTVFKSGDPNLQFDASALEYQIVINQNARTRLQSYVSQGYTHLYGFVNKWFYGDGSNISTGSTWYVLLCKQPFVQDGKYLSFDNPVRLNDNHNNTEVRNGNVITISPSTYDVGIYNGTFSFNIGDPDKAYWIYSNDGNVPTVPPTNWPEPDPTPTPDPPTVDPPTTPDPPNVPTTPTPPTYPPEVTYPDVTYVEADLTAVLDALNEHCEHLQHAIYTASSNLYSSLSSAISGEFTSLKTFLRALASWNVDAINSNFDALYTYLDDFTSWLDSKLRFDDVILLLQAIYNGLPDSVDMTNTNALLQDIYNGMAELDTSSDDLVDLSALESGVYDISADVELIIQALNNLQDDNQLPTIRGYLKQIYDELDSLNLTVGAIVIPAGSDYSTVLQNIYDEVSEYTNTFVQFWDDLRSYLDDILDALDNLEITPRVRYTPTNPPEIPDAPDLDADLNVDALRDALSRLMQKFPFSTINNFVLILTLLTRPAQAPVFDLPLPNPSDWSSPYMVNVDLSIWDVPAAVLRTGIVIWAIARVSRRTVSMWTREEGGGQ